MIALHGRFMSQVAGPLVHIDPFELGVHGPGRRTTLAPLGHIPGACPWCPAGLRVLRCPARGMQ